MRIKTVADLKEALEELPEDMQIMCVFQREWPLREIIGGIWVDDGTSDEEEDNSCLECGRVTLGEPYEDGDNWLRRCFHCDSEEPCEAPMKEEDKVAYIVLSGHPYEGTPYGSKRAWNEI